MGRYDLPNQKDNSQVLSSEMKKMRPIEEVPKEHGHDHPIRSLRPEAGTPERHRRLRLEDMQASDVIADTLEGARRGTRSKIGKHAPLPQKFLNDAAHSSRGKRLAARRKVFEAKVKRLTDTSTSAWHRGRQRSSRRRSSRCPTARARASRSHERGRPAVGFYGRRRCRSRIRTASRKRSRQGKPSTAPAGRQDELQIK